MAIGALKFIGLALGAVALGVVSTSFAFGQMGPGPGGFAGPGQNGWLARADADKDGAISFDEVKAMRGARFAEFDRNKDSAVSPEEIEAVVRQRVERITKRIIRRFDKDRDGTITQDEFNRFAVERFSWLDLNDDGKVSRDEMPRRMRNIMWR
ncbi:EF hand [bacterium BMS3Bbin10]|nr:EF hand [bacterium BMS3Bbin10]